MTTGELDSKQEQPPKAVVPKPDSFGKRVREWFWRGDALAEQRLALPEPSARVTTLAQRARSSADLALDFADLARSSEVAHRAVTPTASLESLAAARTMELYWQSIYWALSALAAHSDPSAGQSYSEATWDTLDEQLLTRAATSAERVADVRSSLRGGSFVYFAELSTSEQTVLSGELAKLSTLLIEILDRRAQALHAVFFQRVSRLLLLFVLFLVVCAGVVWERKTRDVRHDLAEGKAWRASSKFENLGCTSPNQECTESPSLFFCTAEEKDPWIEFDLDSSKEISAVQADNRIDCCQDRAFPLIVEVSENHKHWKTVARRDSDFTTWRASFAPVKARWVRLRAQKVTFLHLSRVRILP